MGLIDALVSIGVLLAFGYVIWAQLKAKQSPVYVAVSNMIESKKPKPQSMEDMQHQIWQNNQGKL